MNRDKRRARAAGRARTQRRTGHRCQGRLAIASIRVVEGREPLRLVMRYADGGWAFLCNTTAEVDQLITVHAQHLFDEYADDLAPLRNLPPGHLAERFDPGHPWRVEEYVEE